MVEGKTDLWVELELNNRAGSSVHGIGEVLQRTVVVANRDEVDSKLVLALHILPRVGGVTGGWRRWRGWRGLHSSSRWRHSIVLHGSWRSVDGSSRRCLVGRRLLFDLSHWLPGFVASRSSGGGQQS